MLRCSLATDVWMVFRFFNEPDSLSLPRVSLSSLSLSASLSLPLSLPLLLPLSLSLTNQEATSLLSDRGARRSPLILRPSRPAVRAPTPPPPAPLVCPDTFSARACACVDVDGNRSSGGQSVAVPAMEDCCSLESARMEAWLDDHLEFTRSYFIRKASR